MLIGLSSHTIATAPQVVSSVLSNIDIGVGLSSLLTAVVTTFITLIFTSRNKFRQMDMKHELDQAQQNHKIADQLRDNLTREITRLHERIDDMSTELDRERRLRAHYYEQMNVLSTRAKLVQIGFTNVLLYCESVGVTIPESMTTLSKLAPESPDDV